MERVEVENIGREEHVVLSRPHGVEMQYGNVLNRKVNGLFYVFKTFLWQL